MIKKKSVIAAIALIALICGVLTGCGGKNSEYEERIAQLESENQTLRDQIDALNAQLQVGSGLYLSDWELTGKAWEGSGGADITFTAQPASYQDGMTAKLVVYLDGATVSTSECQWDGSSFKGRASLPADDGYGYYCLLTDAKGSSSQVLLASPENPVEYALVYLQTGLTAYCNVFLQDWSSDGNSLTISSGYATVQLPQLPEDGVSVGFRGARLAMLLNGEEIDSVNLDMPEGEGAGSYEAVLENIRFQLPELGEDDQLDLMLLATLTSDAVISTNAGSWFLSDGHLNLVVG